MSTGPGPAPDRRQDSRAAAGRAKDPVLPEHTADDTDALGGDWREDDRLREDAARDDWLESERPPHWE